MAHSISSKKRVRQNARRRAINRTRRTGLKSQLRKATDSLTASAAGGTADKSLREIAQVLDRAAARGTIHRNAAARRKSRLARRVNAMKRSTAS